MKANFQDDRTDEQRATHQYAVVAHDKCLSGWGGARGGKSWCGWACETLTDAKKAAEWVRNRSEMRRVRVVHLKRYRVPRSAAHFHLCVTGPDHPALQ